jgi:hypothetical protein
MAARVALLAPHDGERSESSLINVHRGQSHEESFLYQAADIVARHFFRPFRGLSLSSFSLLLRPGQAKHGNGWKLYGIGGYGFGEDGSSYSECRGQEELNSQRGRRISGEERGVL